MKDNTPRTPRHLIDDGNEPIVTDKSSPEPPPPGPQLGGLGGWWGSLSRYNKAFAAFVVLDVVLLAAVAIPRGVRGDPVANVPPAPTARASAQTTTAPTSQATPIAEPTAEPTPTPEPTPEPTPTPVPTPTPEPPPLFEDISLTGRGSEVVRFSLPPGNAAIAKMSNKGSGNFIVWAVDSTGSQTDLLANTIGAYAGTVLFNIAGNDIAAIEVTSNGAWTILVRTVNRAPAWNPRAPLSAEGDAVYRVTPPPSGLVTATLRHRGDSNFIVWAYGESSTILANEIGDFDGEKLMPSGTFLITVQADGAWTIALE